MPSNKLEVGAGPSILPWEWHNLGAVFGSAKSTAQCVAARANFTVRRGFDSGEGVDYGRVVEGLGALGVNLRAQDYAFQLTASDLSYKSGNDEPLRAQSLVGNALASLKLSVAKEYREDSYVALSYDVKQRKPELAVAWAGQTFTERATLLLRADPVDRVLRVGAAVSFPGPEWREDVYDISSDTVQVPRDDGGRHKLWVAHEMRPRALLGRTQLGARLDVGRVINYVADFVDYNLEHRIPGIVWRIPLSMRLYNLLVPAEDDEQYRHRIRGHEFEVVHDSSARAPSLALSQRMGSVRVGARYDLAEHSAALEVSRPGVSLVAHLGQRANGWRSNPSLQLTFQPLALL